MRLLTGIAIIMIALVGSGLVLNHALQDSTRALTRQIDRVDCNVRAYQWQEAQKEIEELKKTWEQQGKWWPIFLDHQEIDNIDFSLARVKEYVAGRDYSLSLGQLSELKLIVDHIPKKEAITLKNIL